MGLAKLLLRVFVLLLKREFVSYNEVASDYNKVAKKYDELFRKEMDIYVKQMVENIPLRGGESIFDLGCGTGAVIDALLKREKEVKITGVDISTGMIEKVKRENVEIYRDEMIHFLKNVEDDSVDVITAAWSLSYAPHKDFLREAKRVLREGGRVAVIINTKETLKETKRAFIQALKRDEKMMVKWMRIYLPKNAESFGKLMSRYGIKPIFMKDDAKTFHFESGSDALSFVLSTGALAGYARCFAEGFENVVAQFHPSYATHRFCIVVGVKESKKRF